MLSNPCLLVTVLFSLMPLVVPPSPTKCLAHAAMFFLPRIKSTLTKNERTKIQEVEFLGLYLQNNNVDGMVLLVSCIRLLCAIKHLLDEESLVTLILDIWES